MRAFYSIQLKANQFANITNWLLIVLLAIGISVPLFVVSFVAVCTQPVGSLFTIKLFEYFCNFFRYFHEAIQCIKWVIVPQIDNSHIDLRFGCWLTSDRNESGGERHRGMTSGQHDPKQPHKNTKAPGRHEATRTHEMT